MFLAERSKLLRLGVALMWALPILVGLPDLLHPSPPEKRNKRKRTFCPARARAHRSPISPASSDADLNSASTSLSPPLQTPGPPKACLLVLRAPLRPALYVVVKAASTPNLQLAVFLLVPVYLSVRGEC